MELTISVPIDGLLVLLWAGLTADVYIWGLVWFAWRREKILLFLRLQTLATGLAVIVAVVATIALTLISGGG